MSGCGYNYRETAITDIGGAFGVNSVAFDRFEEILWSGNAAGHVSSHIGPNLGRYTSFQVHMEEEIRQILPIESVVLCLTRSALRGQLRRGIPAFTFKSDLITDLQTALATGPAAVLLGGHQEKILEVDLNNQRIIRIVNDNTSGCSILRRQSRYICCGGFDGKISLRDPLTMTEEHSLTAHMSVLNDFDVQGNTLISCGYSMRSGAMIPDRFLTVYDLRMNRKMSPVPLSLEPFLLKFMPAFSSRLALLSTMGQLIVFDAIAGPASGAMMEHVTPNGAIGLSLDISSSCQCIAVGDSTGYVHRFSISPDSVVNSFSRPTEFADPIIPIEPIAVDDLSAALSSIPMPVTPSKRLSDWPAELIKPRYRPTPPIPDDILESMRMVGTIGYAPKPANRRPNQISYPNFRSLSKGASAKPKKTGDSEDWIIPKKFRRMEPRTKNLEDYDFSFYNRTKLPGLENSLMNSYCNPGLQMLYYHPTIRYHTLSHLCKEESCLKCELSFLFHMLDQTPPGIAPVYPTNFLRTFRFNVEATNLGLVLPDFSENLQEKFDASKLFQTWVPFIYQQLVQSRPDDASSNIIQHSFSFQQLLTTTCLICGSASGKRSTSVVLNMNYKDVEKENKDSLQFSSLVSNSFSFENYLDKAWCECCQQYNKAQQARKIERLPEVLTINCDITSEDTLVLLRPVLESDVPTSDNKQMKTQKICWDGIKCKNTMCKFLHHDAQEFQKYWIPERLCLKLGSDGTVYKTNNKDEKENRSYVLHSVIYKIVESKTSNRHHLVACIRVNPFYHEVHGHSDKGEWYLFNDYCVKKIGIDDALVCAPQWKVPCFVSYILEGSSLPLSTPTNPIAREVFSDNWELKVLKNPREGPFKPLGSDEHIGKGTLVSMDAEFVTLQSEEAELKSEGKPVIIRPSHKAVARITVIRGEGEDEGVPFLDDYISTFDHVADYLTAYSGIQPGDLDARSSARCLATLKSAYVRLRHLVDIGVVFVGHGLKNDFFVINLLVPPEQIRDTVQLFHLPHQRMISLKFLAWYYLGANIQSGSHDSFEDARTALKLYRIYTKLINDEKTLRDSLKKLYEAGTRRSWLIEKPLK